MTTPNTRTEPTEPDEIRRDIEESREQLAETVDALTARLDVKSRATSKVHAVRDTATERVHEVRDTATQRANEVRDQAVTRVRHARSWAEQTWSQQPQAVAAAAAAAVAAVVVVLFARRRS